VAALLAWAALECFGPLHSQGIAPGTMDWMQRHRLWASAPDPRLLIIDIDERSLAEMAPEFGRWPWPRDTLATLLDHAEAQHAAAVVFDILFSDPDRLRPGGDRALDAVVARSGHSFFPVLRLAARSDGASALAVDRLPGLAQPSAAAVRPAPTVAAVLPFMAAMQASGRLGVHTVQLAPDGILRRHAATEEVQGWHLASMPSAVAQALGHGAAPDSLARPVVWRARVDSYPRVPFSLAWACADGGRCEGCPSLAGRILVLGATAPSLHDLRSTPLAVDHPGPDILATLIDNALHQRAVAELSAAQRFVLTVGALALAVWVARRAGVAGTSRVLVVLPLALLALGWASLHTERWWLDLTLPAAVALLYLSALRGHDALRRRWLGLQQAPTPGCHALWLRCPGDGEQLERRLLDAVATTPGTAASAWQDVCGVVGAAPTPALPAVWVVWQLADRAQAEAFQCRLAAWLPTAECGHFTATAAPDGGLHAALAEAAQHRA
jgi:CHASE2 domain-containing sensor protein